MMEKLCRYDQCPRLVGIYQGSAMAPEIRAGPYLVLCQPEGYDDHRRVVGDPANQEAAHDEEGHLRCKQRWTS